MNALEQKIIYDRYGKWLWVMRSMPSHAVHWLLGMQLPTHEQHFIRIYFANYRENNVIASRGTSKSFSFTSASAPVDAMLHRNQDTLAVSASGFRGGKLLFEDTKRMVLGELRSQRLPARYMHNSCKSNKVIRQEPDRWIVGFSSHSQVMTVPTNNADAMRGIRARKAIVDERNTFDGEVVQAVIRPMMNVGGEFEKIASADEDNSIFQVSTIDYTFRDWYKEIAHQTKLAERQYQAEMARKGGDWTHYHRLMEENRGELKTASFSLTRFDYTDLIIPTEIESYEGSRYRVEYPLPANLVREDVVKWDERDGCEYIYTYPVDKALLEEPRNNQTMDEDLWLAEQRNVFIEASGNVYPDSLIRKASEHPIYRAGEIPNYDAGVRDEEGKAIKEQFEFYAPVMYRCGDACVLGVDYARERDDFAVVVFRLGPLSSGKFDPSGERIDELGRPVYGETPWSSVIWAESWPHTTAADAADKIRQLRDRYNLLNATGHNNGFGGIGLDGRGGGRAVADELAQPRPSVLSNGLPDPNWKEPVKLYDPEDEKFGHYASLPDTDSYWSGLRLLKPTNAENWEWTRLTKAGMEQSGLYIGYWEAPSTWAARKGITNQTGSRDSTSSEYQKWLIGYNGIKKLCRQLVSLQVEQTPSGLLRVVMPGRQGTEEAKKDLYSAFIYGWHTAREHLINETKQDDSPPSAIPVAVEVGGRALPQVGWGSGRIQY